jgi:2,3-bisphosphoglycerate-dependent phosphoglycerate mutase
MSIEIVFETHSLTEDNEAGIATGWLPGRLSEQGSMLAVALGDRRVGDGLSAVFTSDLRRAVETAELAFDGTGIPVVADARLRECNYGELNGMARSQLEGDRAHHLDVPYPSGESWRAAIARVEGFLNEVASACDGQRLLLIGHVATRWALDHYVDGMPLERLVVEDFAWRPGWEYRLRSPSDP